MPRRKHPCENILIRFPRPEKIRVPMTNAIQIIREEFVKAATAAAAVYRMLREIDTRTMEIFIALLKGSK